MRSDDLTARAKRPKSKPVAQPGSERDRVEHARTSDLPARVFWAYARRQ